ncbi:MAG: YicC family protein [Planctomycetes bacterium]|nr:YicC family protein [Planctomycetota bacterium]
MTGFGEALLEEDGQAYHLEIRGVNNRYFKSAIRLPEDFAYLETQLEQLLRRRLIRGSIALRLYVRDLSASAAQDVNVAAIEHYVTQLKSVLPAEPNFTIDLATLAALPGVCQPHEMTEQQREHGEELIARLAETAIDKLLEMRAAEGQTLAEDLKRHCDSILERLEAIRAHAPGMVERYRERLTARIEELIAGSNVRLAEEDLLREVSVYAERSDVNEELSRLGSHLAQFKEAITGSEPAGRKLDFITQEMLREANTIGAKAGDAEVARHVVEIKGAVDRLKEQVQNVV